MSLLLCLPEEITFHMLQMLVNSYHDKRFKVKTMFILRRVCKQIQRIIEDDRLWKPICYEVFYMYESQPTPHCIYKEGHSGIRLKKHTCTRCDRVKVPTKKLLQREKLVNGPRYYFFYNSMGATKKIPNKPTHWPPSLADDRIPDLSPDQEIEWGSRAKAYGASIESNKQQAIRNHNAGVWARYYHKKRKAEDITTLYEAYKWLTNLSHDYLLPNEIRMLDVTGAADWFYPPLVITPHPAPDESPYAYEARMLKFVPFLIREKIKKVILN